LGFGLVWLFISWVWVGWGGWDSYLASFIVLGGWAVWKEWDRLFAVEAHEIWMVAWPDGSIRLEVTFSLSLKLSLLGKILAFLSLFSHLRVYKGW